MRIAWFTHRYYPCRGGSENFGRAMVRRFARAGHGVDVLTSDAFDLWYFTDPNWKRVEGERDEMLDGARIQRFPVRHIPLQRYVGRLLSYVPHWPTRCRIASYMPIVPEIERVRAPYDAVFSLGFPYTVFSFAAWKTAKAAGAPLILTPFLHLSTPGDLVNRNYTRPHQIRLLREADTVVVQTDIEAGAVESWGIPRERIFKLGMAVDHAEITGGNALGFRSQLGIPAQSFVVGQLGANDPNKGTTDLIRAVERLNAARPRKAPVHLVLAGQPSPAFEEFVAALPSETSAWLHILGLLPDEDRRHFYAALDVFAMPSRTDSFGIVFLEAWANKKPVVAAAAGGVAEVVQHDRTGLLVPFGDVEQLANAIGSLDRDRTLAARLGAAGQTLVSQRGFTWDDRFAALSGLLDSLVARRKSRRQAG